MDFKNLFLLGIYGLISVSILTLPFSLMHIKELTNSKREFRVKALIIIIFIIYLFVLFDQLNQGTIWDYKVWGLNEDSIVEVALMEKIFSALKMAFIFIPLGVFLPYLSNDKEVAPLTLFLGLMTSILIEISQMVNSEISSWSHVLYNLIGLLIGLLFWFTLGDKVNKFFSSFRNDNHSDWIFPLAVILIAFFSRFLIFNKPTFASLLLSI